MLCCPLGWQETSLGIEMREEEGQRQQVNDPEMCSVEAEAAEQGGRVQGRPGSGVQAPDRVGQPGRVARRWERTGLSPVSGVRWPTAMAVSLSERVLYHAGCGCAHPDSLAPGAKLLPVFHTLPHILAFSLPAPRCSPCSLISLEDPSLWSRVNTSSRRGILLLCCLSPHRSFTLT